MKNPGFHQQLRRLEYDGRPLTLAVVARELEVTANHLSEAVNRKPRRPGQFGSSGRRLRAKLCLFLREHWPEESAELVTSLQEQSPISDYAPRGTKSDSGGL